MAESTVCPISSIVKAISKGRQSNVARHDLGPQTDSHIRHTVWGRRMCEKCLCNSSHQATYLTPITIKRLQLFYTHGGKGGQEFIGKTDLERDLLENFPGRWIQGTYHPDYDTVKF